MFDPMIQLTNNVYNVPVVVEIILFEWRMAYFCIPCETEGLGRAYGCPSSKRETLKSDEQVAKNILYSPTVLSKLSVQEMCLNYHWPQLSERYFAVSVWYLAWSFCLKRKVAFLIAVCQPAFPSCLIFLFLEIVLHCIRTTFPLCSQLMIITSVYHLTAV